MHWSIRMQLNARSRWKTIKMGHTLCVSFFSHSWEKVTDKGNRKMEEFTLAHGFRGTRESWWGRHGSRDNGWLVTLPSQPGSRERQMHSEMANSALNLRSCSYFLSTAVYTKEDVFILAVNATFERCVDSKPSYWGWKWGLVVQLVLRVHETLGSIPSTPQIHPIHSSCARRTRKKKQ